LKLFLVLFCRELGTQRLIVLLAASVEQLIQGIWRRAGFFRLRDLGPSSSAAMVMAAAALSITRVQVVAALLCI
jgi:hypothetical protein